MLPRIRKWKKSPQVFFKIETATRVDVGNVVCYFATLAIFRHSTAGNTLPWLLHHQWNSGPYFPRLLMKQQHNILKYTPRYKPFFRVAKKRKQSRHFATELLAHCDKIFLDIRTFCKYKNTKGVSLNNSAVHNFFSSVESCFFYW